MRAPAVAATAATESLLGATEGVSCRVRGRNDEITNIIYWDVYAAYYLLVIIQRARHRKGYTE